MIAKQPINENHLSQGMQRHQAFLAELEAHQDRMESILKSGAEIAEKNSDQAYIINEKSELLKNKKMQLDNLCEAKSRDYQDAQALRDFMASCKARVVKIKIKISTIF